jgi:hypothetical protein
MTLCRGYNTTAAAVTGLQLTAHLFRYRAVFTDDTNQSASGRGTKIKPKICEAVNQRAVL